MIVKEDLEKEKEVICSISSIKKRYIKIKSARFECPSCGNIIEVLQITKTFRTPSRCSCGRRGGFKVFSKKVIEAQDIVIKEKDSGFEYTCYLEGEEILNKLTNLKDKRFVKINGTISDEYLKKSISGNFVIVEVKSIEEEEDKKPDFLR